MMLSIQIAIPPTPSESHFATFNARQSYPITNNIM